MHPTVLFTSSTVDVYSRRHIYNIMRVEDKGFQTTFRMGIDINRN